MMNPELKKKLEELARMKTWEDEEDFCPCDFCGGNYDDAYYGGESDGEVNLARTLLKEFGDSL